MKMATEGDTISQIGLFENTRNVMRGLKKLKGEHDRLLVKLSAEKQCEVQQSPSENAKCHVKYDLVKNSLTRIENGIGEAQLMVIVNNHLIDVEGERLKLEAQVKRLIQENSWLNEELAATQEKLLSSEKNVVQLEEQKEHLEYINSLMHYEKEKFQEELSGHSCNADTIFVSEEEEVEEEKEDEVKEDDDEEEEETRCNDASWPATSVNLTEIHDIPSRLKTFHSLVRQYASEGRYEVAVKLCNQVIEDLENTSGHDDPDVATTLNILALVYRDQGKYKKATTLLTEALCIRERTLGCNHPTVATTLNNLAMLYGKRGKYVEADPLCKRALEILREKVLVNKHPDVARQVNNLSPLREELREEIETYRHQHAFDNRERNRDPEHRNAAEVKTDLASSYLAPGKYKTAQHSYKGLFTRPSELQSGKDNNHPRGVNNTLYPTRDGDQDVKIDTPKVGFALKNIWDLYRHQGRSATARTAKEYPGSSVYATTQVQSKNIRQKSGAFYVNC